MKRKQDCLETMRKYNPVEKKKDGEDIVQCVTGQINVPISGNTDRIVPTHIPESVVWK